MQGSAGPARRARHGPPAANGPIAPIPYPDDHVLAVPAPTDERTAPAADVLRAHGGRFVDFFISLMFSLHVGMPFLLRG